MTTATRQWEELKPHQFSNIEYIDLADGHSGEVAGLLGKLRPNEYYSRTFTLDGNINDTRPLERYISLLQEAGLKIGKGDLEYGYRMPIPKKDTNQRQLIIFRRR